MPPLPAEGIGTEGTAGLGGTLPANRQPPPGGRTGQLHRRHRVHTSKSFYGNEPEELYAGTERYAVAAKRNTGSEPKTLLTQIAQCYHATGNQAQAYAYMDSARMWTDTLAQQNLTRQMAEFNVKYQTQEKELQIANLKQQQLEHQALLLKGAIGSGLLLICISIILLGVYHKKRTAEQKIELLKQENDLNSARRYIEGLETECKYFAKELHDGIANDLLALQMKMSNQTSKTMRKS